MDKDEIKFVVVLAGVQSVAAGVSDESLHQQIFAFSEYIA